MDKSNNVIIDLSTRTPDLSQYAANVITMPIMLDIRVLTCPYNKKEEIANLLGLSIFSHNNIFYAKTLINVGNFEDDDVEEYLWIELKLEITGQVLYYTGS